MIKHSEQFQREAVRMALNSGLSGERLEADLGLGKSKLGKWLAFSLSSSLNSRASDTSSRAMLDFQL